MDVWSYILVVVTTYRVFNFFGYKVIMIYDEIYLFEKIMDSLLMDGMTQFNDTHFEFDDCFVIVNGYVQQDVVFEYSSDHFLLSGMELQSRTANFDEITIVYDTVSYLFTNDELYSLEKKINV